MCQTLDTVCQTDGQVTTLAVRSDPVMVDGADAGAHFNWSYALALDERGRLLVSELVKVDTLWVVEASLVAPLWMGPVEESVEGSEMVIHDKTQDAIADPHTGV